MRDAKQSLIDRLLDLYEATGTLPGISGGDHEEGDGDEDDSKDGNRADKKSGTESKNDSGREKRESGNSFKPITSQDDLDAIVVKRLRRQEKNLREEITQEIQEALKTEAARKEAEENGNYKKLYEESQTEVEKLKKQLADKDAEVKQKTLDELRQEVIDEFQLPKDLADRLVGETKEELKADAKKLSEVIVPREAPDIDAGKSGGAGDKKKKAEDKAATKDPNYWGLPS